MAKRVILLLLLGGLSVLFYRIVMDIGPITALSPLSQQMVTEAPLTLGSQNVITAIVVTMRGLDTLGEVAVLFIAAAGIGFLLRRNKERTGEKRRDGSEILKTGARLLLPLILLFGVYIFTHGHLTPGGGFQGGVIIASALLLMVLSDVNLKISYALLSLSESVSGFAYTALGIAGFFLAAGFLDNRFLPIGVLGSFLSAGAIPVIYSFIGIKVGCELTGIFTTLQEDV
jgi:multicomponent Na+:H+ antiporter subunit B